MGVKVMSNQSDDLNQIKQMGRKSTRKYNFTKELTYRAKNGDPMSYGMFSAIVTTDIRLYNFVLFAESPNDALDMIVDNVNVGRIDHVGLILENNASCTRGVYSIEYRDTAGPGKALW